MAGHLQGGGCAGDMTPGELACWGPALAVADRVFHRSSALLLLPLNQLMAATCTVMVVICALYASHFLTFMATANFI